MRSSPETFTEASNTDESVRIAVLDDDADFRNYLEDALKDESGYAVSTYAHPEDLFAACEQELPGIVLLDMKMGEFRGDQVLEQLLTSYPALCVIIVTGYPSLEDMRATFQNEGFRLYPEAVLSGSATPGACQRRGKVRTGTRSAQSLT